MFTEHLNLSVLQYLLLVLNRAGFMLISASKFTFFNIDNAYLYPFLASLEVELDGNIAIKKALRISHILGLLSISA